MISYRRIPNYREIIFWRLKYLLQYLELFPNGDIANHESNERDIVQSKKKSKMKQNHRRPTREHCLRSQNDVN